MNKWSRFAGIAGLVVLLFGVVGVLVFGWSGLPSFLLGLLGLHFMAGLALVLSWFFLYGLKNISSASEVVGARQVRFSVNLVLYALVFAGLLVAVNWYGSQHKKRWDVTLEGVYSLAPQSKSSVETLKKPLKIVAFRTDEMPDTTQAEELLKLYVEANPSKVTFESVDPQTRPNLVDKYGMKPGNLVYFEYGEGENPGVSRINEVSEEAVTNAIIKLTRGDAKKVYFVEGHDEPGMEDASARGLKAMADSIKDEHLALDTLFLGQIQSIPQDAAAVVLVSPKKLLLPQEKNLLIKYVEEGGRLLMMTDPRTTEDVASIADHFGIQVGKDLVVDLIQRLLDAPAIGAQIVARDYAQHGITRSMTSANKTVFNIASSVTPKSSGKADGKEGTWTEIVKSSQSSWGEKNLSLIFDTDTPSIAQDPEDTKGPVALAVAYEKKVEDKKGADKDKEADFEKTSRVVVFGDSDWVANGIYGFYSNRDLLLNTLNWLVGEEGGVTIRPRALKASIAPISKTEFEYIIASSLLIPELILIVGIFVWWRRRTVENA